MASWKRLSKTRKAAMALSCSQMTKFLMAHQGVVDYLNGVKDTKDEKEKEQESVNGELIWDTLCKSGIGQRPRNALAKCFELASGLKVFPNTIYEYKGSNFGNHVWDKEWGFLPLLVIANPNDHNYRLNEVCILRYAGNRQSALRISGSTGNNLPSGFSGNFAIPSVEQIKRFFSSVSGPRLEYIRRFFDNGGYNDSPNYRPFINDTAAAHNEIERYGELYEKLKEGGLIPWQ